MSEQPAPTSLGGTDAARAPSLDELHRAVTAFLATIDIAVASKLTPETNLIESGILDSLATVKFVLFVETMLRIEIPLGDFTLEKIASVAAIHANYAAAQPPAPLPAGMRGGTADGALVSCRGDGAGAWSAWTGEVRVPPFAAGLQFGVSVFEGMQALPDGEGGYRVPFLAEHDARLRVSAATLGIAVPDPATFAEGIRLAIARRPAPPAGEAGGRIYLRAVLFAGCEDIFPRSAPPYFCNIFARPVR